MGCGNAGDVEMQEMLEGEAGTFLNQPPGGCISSTLGSYGPGAEHTALWSWVFPVVLHTLSEAKVPLSLFPLL